MNEWASFGEVKPNFKTQKNINMGSDKLDRTARYINSNRKPDAGPIIVLQNDKDISKNNDLITALPQGKKGIAKAFKKVADVQLEEDGILAMIGSGSFDHAADAEEEFPDHCVTPPPPGAQEAETACGGILKHLGTVKVEAEANGHAIGIKFVNMKVKCPI